MILFLVGPGKRATIVEENPVKVTFFDWRVDELWCIAEKWKDEFLRR